MLIAAPTGSGKTLAAFLAAIDGLVRQGIERRPAGRDADRLCLAAEGAVERHPARTSKRRSPASREELRARGLPDVEIRTWVRTGDTPSAERDRDAPPAAAHPRDDAGIALHPARLRIRPPHAGDREDRHRRRDPRGRAEQARLASGAVARAARRAVRPAVAAHRPVGDAEADRGGRALPGRRRPPGGPAAATARSSTPAIAGARDLALEVPSSPLEAVMSDEVWEEVYDRIAELIQAHRTTLVFVNTRRMAERATRALSERLGEDQVAAHHGSLVEGTPARRRTAAQRRRAEGAGRDRLARTRHRYRRGRSGLPARLAALDRGVSAARRALGSRGRRHAEGPAVPAVARRAGRMRRAARQRRARRTRPPQRSRSGRSTCWRSRSSPRSRRRNGARTALFALFRRAWPVSRAAARGFRRDRADAGGGVQHAGAAGAAR